MQAVDLALPAVVDLVVPATIDIHPRGAIIDDRVVADMNVSRVDVNRSIHDAGSIVTWAVEARTVVTRTRTVRDIRTSAGASEARERRDRAIHPKEVTKIAGAGASIRSRQIRSSGASTGQIRTCLPDARKIGAIFSMTGQVWTGRSTTREIGTRRSAQIGQ